VLVCVTVICILFCVYVYFLFSLCFLCGFSFVDLPSVLWYCWLGLLTCKNCLPYNLYCVGGDVKHCSLTYPRVAIHSTVFDLAECSSVCRSYCLLSSIFVMSVLPCLTRYPVCLSLSALVSSFICVWRYRGGSPTAVQAWQPCHLWEPSPRHPILLCRLGTCCAYFVYIIVCAYVYFVVFVVWFVLCSISFSTLILLVGSFDL